MFPFSRIHNVLFKSGLILLFFCSALFITACVDTKPRNTVQNITITYNTCGGNEIEAVTAKPQSNVAAPQNPVRAGFDFLGWYLQDSEKVYVFEKMPEESITLYAKWQFNGIEDLWNDSKDLYTEIWGKNAYIDPADVKICSGEDFFNNNKFTLGLNPVDGEMFSKFDKVLYSSSSPFAVNCKNCTTEEAIDYLENLFKRLHSYLYNFQHFGDTDVVVFDTMLDEVLKGVKKIGNAWYSMDMKKMVKYQGQEDSFTVPSGVAEISDLAFMSSTLKSITLPDTVIKIKAGAFGNCAVLENINIPQGVTELGFSAFGDCKKLEQITIPPGISVIEGQLFYGCQSLDSVNIPQGVTEIGESAFNSCAITSIDIPAGVTKCGEYVFSNCMLTEITLPDTFTEIYAGMFANCNGLTSVTILSNIMKIGNSAFSNCENLTSVTIQGGITEIGSSAFFNCNKLASVTIPDSVTGIGSDAFSYCSSITSISIPSNLTKIESGTFFNCSGLTAVTIPGNVKSIGDDAFKECKNLVSVTINEGVERIGNDVFRDCANLENINIPDSAEYIENIFFTGSKVQYEIYNDLKYINNWLFGINNNTLTLPELKETTKGILPGAFSGSSITEITITQSVKIIGNYAFADCNSLTTITIPSGVKEIGNYAFSGCESLTTAILNEGVKRIGENAFGYCNNLLSLNIPDSVKYIGNNVFNGCQKLNYETYNGLKYINNWLFGVTDRSISELTMKVSTRGIYNSAFEYCNNLSQLMIPESVVFIGERVTIDSHISTIDIKGNNVFIKKDAFTNSSYITEITIRGEDIEMENYAIYSCPNLNSIILYAETPFENKNFIDSHSASVKIYVPGESVNAYKTAEGWENYAYMITAMIN